MFRRRSHIRCIGILLVVDIFIIFIRRSDQREVRESGGRRGDDGEGGHSGQLAEIEFSE